MVNQNAICLLKTTKSTYMFGSKLIEKLINDTSISVSVEQQKYTVVLQSNLPLFHIYKNTCQIKLTRNTWELIENSEVNLCNVVLCTYLKLNYLLQHGYMKLFIEGNEKVTEKISLKKIQNCLSFFEELKGERTSNLSDHQLHAINVYGKNLHESSTRV